LGVVALVAGLYAVGAQLTFLVGEPAAGIAFFPPAGVTLAALLLVRDRRMWPVIVMTIAATEIAIDVGHGQAVGLAVGFGLANALEPLVSAHLLVRRPDARSLAAPQAFRRFVAIGVVLGPFVGAVIGATTSALGGETGSWFSTFGNWWAGDSIGVLVVATPIIAWALRRSGAMKERIPVAESLAVAAAAIAVATLSLFVWDQPPLYAVTLILMWGALRCGFTVVATTGFVIAWIADAGAIMGRGQYARLAGGDTSLALLFVQLFLGLTLISTLLLATEVGERVRTQRKLARAEGDRLRSELNAFGAAMEERNRIAGEVHDIVGHTLNVVVLQVGAARRLMPVDSTRALEILGSVEQNARGGLRELDLALRVVGHVDPLEGEASRGLAQLPAVVGAMNDAGVPVDLCIEGEPRPLATLTDWSAYRVVQEALTNVVKHAGYANVRVTIGYAADHVSVEIVDDGVGTAAGANGSGRGLLGMRERVTSLGGTLRCGGEAGGGYVVAATFPTGPGS
jgi:signal transduction histidine kinase